MIQHDEARRPGRWWTAVIEASAAAVAIHYAAPWRDRKRAPVARKPVS